MLERRPIISMPHHFFKHHGIGETTAHMHADSCCGQNKNKYMMQYLMWRTMVGYTARITPCTKKVVWLCETSFISFFDLIYSSTDS